MYETLVAAQPFSNDVTSLMLGMGIDVITLSFSPALLHTESIECTVTCLTIS